MGREEKKRAKSGGNPWAAAMLVSVPLGVLVGVLVYVWHGGTYRLIVERQFANCYVSIPVFLAVVLSVVSMFFLCARVGVHPFVVVSRRHLRFLFYIVTLAILGTFVLKTRFLSGHWFYLSFSETVAVAITNFLMVIAGGGAYLFVFPLWKDMNISIRGKACLLIALLLWGYLLASGFRMLPLPYLTGLE